MSKPSKRRLDKKKKRDEQNKRKVFLKRIQTRKETAENKRIAKIVKEAEPKRQPIVNLQAPKTAEEIARQIEKNFEVLRALEDEYAKEIAEREGLNEALEAEGYKTLKEKLDYLSKKAEQEAKEIYENRIKDGINGRTSTI